MNYEIKLTHGEDNLFVSSNSHYEIADTVVIKTEKYKVMGRIVRKVSPELLSDGYIVSQANALDFELAEKVAQDSDAAKITVKRLVQDHSLDMKVIEVKYTLDYKRLYISFTAEHRVDFRALLKDLASSFKTRIELRQIGSRDVAKTFGGIGPCGRPLCCSEFMGEFPNVSIKMAKNQVLSLNQSKLNGLCGRLMCCLSYEDDFYRQAREKFPDFGDTIKTVDGQARVIGLNILSNTVKARLDNQIQDYDVSEIEVV
ncbi:regulatory iron-sulfur-containing complex subunit RicT [Pseudolactococcus chungangensis]|uniref:regulatory iron-sulfur-containing complex subunit RicT n=1 Tax=Pseudolactococcus chungangensis TaxID=451457 RepID=UPI0028D86DC5|nr:regulatory iron-sulfur-containing complex subunit RicT [Lactococcus chungangensis]